MVGLDVLHGYGQDLVGDQENHGTIALGKAAAHPTMMTDSDGEVVACNLLSSMMLANF